MPSIYDVWTARHGKQAEQAAAMLHTIPDAPVVDREAFVLERCAGKRVLHVGSNGTDGSGRFHNLIMGVAEVAYSMDREGTDYNCDLDYLPDFSDIAESLDVDLVVCGEVLEHLANPGDFLRQLFLLDTPVIITVPNAFSATAHRWVVQNGRECVNADHVCWYSYHTLRTLVERYGYTVAEWYWYNGQPRTAEGLVFVVTP